MAYMQDFTGRGRFTLRDGAAPWPDPDSWVDVGVGVGVPWSAIGVQMKSQQ